MHKHVRATRKSLPLRRTSPRNVQAFDSFTHRRITPGPNHSHRASPDATNAAMETIPEGRSLVAAEPTPASATASTTVSPTQAITYLTQFIGRNLRVHVTDKRMFIGQMKCTDKVSSSRPQSPSSPPPTTQKPNLSKKQDRNIILALTHEYRPPSEAAIRAVIAASGDPSVQLPLSSRYVGLVVVPGRYVTRIECEENPWAPASVVPLTAPVG